MGLVELIVLLVVVGLLIWLVDYLPIDGRIKTVVIVLVILLAVLRLLGYV